MAVMKKRPKILLIDQHPEWLGFAQDVLNEDYDVIAHKNWDNLLSPVKDENTKAGGFDLVFIGLELATNNLDALKPFFKQWNFVVVFPVIETNETVRLLFKAGVYDCARKPYEREGLLKLVADELVIAKVANGKKIAPSPILSSQSGDIAKQLATLLKLEETSNGTQEKDTTS